jgi:hypothetical protein
MINKYVPLICFCILINYIVGCSAEKKDDIIAAVGDLSISREEFKLTYQFNPYLAQITNPQTAKYYHLNTLIASKMFAQEGYSKKVQEAPSVKQIIEQFEREALIEKLWQDKIVDQVLISEDEVYQAYVNSKYTHIFQYFIFENSEEAENVYKQLGKGTNFQTIASLRGIPPETIPIDSLSFGSDIPGLEEKVMQMTIDEVSTPVQLGHYFFIVKLINKKQNLFSSEADFKKNYRKLEKTLRKRKQQQAFNSYIKKNLKQAPYILNKKIFKQLVQQLESTIDFQYQKKTKQTTQLPENISQEDIKNLGDILLENVVKFSNNNLWNIQKLLSRIRVSPYPIEFSSPGKFRSSMITATKMVLDDQVLVDLAQYLKIEKTTYVTTHRQMWQDHTIYKLVLRDLVQDMVFTADSVDQEKKQKKYLERIDDYLADIAGKYSVTLYKDILDTLKLSKTDMVVMKTHFPQRTIAPVIQPLTYLPKFENILSAQAIKD